ncbi:MAG: histidine phosphatase family protein [Bacteroidetes bacterium]|nr:histidine phosphatase family protein [Bacteroidota bacterium]
MHTLYLIRHAKSDWENQLADFERPLNGRGLHNAPLMGQLLKAQGVQPDLVVSSPAVRALHTAQLVAEELGYEPTRIRTEPRIYEAMTSTLQEIIHSLPDTAATVLLFGHNPGFTRLANLLCTDLELDNLPTCGIVALGFATGSWRAVEAGTGSLLLLDYPRRHTG